MKSLLVVHFVSWQQLPARVLITEAPVDTGIPTQRNRCMRRLMALTVAMPIGLAMSEYVADTCRGALPVRDLF